MPSIIVPRKSAAGQTNTRVPVVNGVHRWACPNCSLEEVTVEPRPHVRMHACPGTRGLTVPMVPLGTRCKVEVRDREDYVGEEMVQKDENGRPVMSVVTTRDNGQDCTVYAPTATGSLRAG